MNFINKILQYLDMRSVFTLFIGLNFVLITFSFNSYKNKKEYDKFLKQVEEYEYYKDRYKQSANKQDTMLLEDYMDFSQISMASKRQSASIRAQYDIENMLLIRIPILGISFKMDDLSPFLIILIISVIQIFAWINFNRVKQKILMGKFDGSATNQVAEIFTYSLGTIIFLLIFF